MDDCYGDQDDRCLVTKGQTVRGQLTFEAHKPTSKLDCQIFGIIGGIMIPFPGGCPVKDGCSDLSSGNVSNDFEIHKVTFNSFTFKGLVQLRPVKRSFITLKCLSTQSSPP